MLMVSISQKRHLNIRYIGIKEANMLQTQEYILSKYSSFRSLQRLTKIPLVKNINLYAHRFLLFKFNQSVAYPADVDSVLRSLLNTSKILGRHSNKVVEGDPRTNENKARIITQKGYR